MKGVARKQLQALRSNLFFVPLLSVVAAVAGGLASLRLDQAVDGAGELPLGIASTVESARAVLSTIASATITFAGIAFSVSLLVFQLASTQYSPRVVNTLFRDSFNKRVMGVVVGTFTYCLIVLRSVRSPLDDGGDAVIPNVSVGIAVVLGIVTILTVVAFINHNAHAMDVSEILERVSCDAVEQAQREWSTDPDAASPTGDIPSDPGHCVRFERSGWVQHMDFDAIADAVPAGSTVVLATFVGRYAIAGAPLCTVHRGPDPDDDAIRRAVILGDTRTSEQDVSYGLRQLADVALRALSPGVNEPTTAQDAIFHTSGVLAELMRRSPVRSWSHDGRRLLFPEAPTHADLVRLAFEEVRIVAAPSPAVCVYILEALHLVTESVVEPLPPDALDEIRRQAELVVRGCEAEQLLAEDVATVRRAFADRFG